MININCSNTHKYGPFKKSNKTFYRICLKCNKKTHYPICEEIETEYNNQKITNFIIEIISKKEINKIQNSNYFFRLITCLIDNISYIYLTKENQEKLIISLNELNNYFNKQEKNRFELIKEAIKYSNKYFINYNNEIDNNYNESKLSSLDKSYLILTSKINKELETIIENEESTTITIDNISQETENITINYNEIESETK